MNIKKWHFMAILTLSIIALLILAGCGGDKQVEKIKKLNITYVKAPLNVPSIVQKKLFLFEKEFGKDGIELVYPEITSGSKQTEALAAGALDFCNALGGTSVLLAAANGVDLKIINMYSRAPKAFMIVSKSPDIQKTDDLKGKKVGGPKGTILHQLLITALATNDLKAQDVDYISMDIATAVSALQYGSIDAALVAGPASLQAIDAGAHIVITGEGLVEGTIVVAVSGKFLKNHPDLVKRFQSVHQESINYIKNNPEEAMRMTAEETGLTIDNVRKMYSWYDFNPEILPSDIEELKRTQDFLVNNEMLTKTINIDDLLLK